MLYLVIKAALSGVIVMAVSEIARPDVLGAIYRVRKKGMKKVDDPRGLALNMGAKSADEIALFLDDPRPAVRERAIELLAGAELGAAIREIHRILVRDGERQSHGVRRPRSEVRANPMSARGGRLAPCWKARLPGKGTRVWTPWVSCEEGWWRPASKAKIGSRSSGTCRAGAAS